MEGVTRKLLETEHKMKKLKSKVIYHGGSLPVPSHFQKGTLELKDNHLLFCAQGESQKYHININIPCANIRGVIAEEKKYYSSTGYFLTIQYTDNDGIQQKIDIEIRCFGRRGTALVVSQLWARTLSNINRGR